MNQTSLHQNQENIFRRAAELIASLCVAVFLVPIEMTIDGLISLRQGLQRPLTDRPTITVLGVRINNMTIDEAIDEIIGRINNGQRFISIYFVNADCLNAAYRNRQYRQTLRQADLVFCEATAVRMAAKLIGLQAHGNLSLADLTERLCEMNVEIMGEIFLYGPRQALSETMAKSVKENYPQIHISGPQNESISLEDESLDGRTISEDQGTFTDRNTKITDALPPFNVDGLFEYQNDQGSRSPAWVTEPDQQWTFQLPYGIQHKAKHYLLDNPLFLWRTLRWKSRVPK
jgi:N-acetylglucosaminyldiphosphoundecaprenol N-acetyl-beta-D-mannosaminyltransferase